MFNLSKNGDNTVYLHCCQQLYLNKDNDISHLKAPLS